jgi:transposase-like protein
MEMLRFNQEFKVQSVQKVLSKRSDQTQKDIADNLGVGHSTLQKWIRLAKENKLEKSQTDMSKEKSPQDWNKAQRFEAIMHCHSLNDEQISTYCRENGIYPHHIKEWKSAFLSVKDISPSLSRQEQKELKQKVKRLQKELNRKDKALSETAALLVLSKKCQAIWGEKEVD